MHMHVRVRALTCVCAHACVYVRVCVRSCVYVCLCSRMCVCVCVCVCLSACIAKCMHECTCVQVCMCMHICGCVYVLCVSIFACSSAYGRHVRMRLYMLVCVCVRVCTHACARLRRSGCGNVHVCNYVNTSHCVRVRVHIRCVYMRICYMHVFVNVRV